MSDTNLLESRRDLLEQAVTVIFISIMANGAPHSTPTWRRWDGQNILVTIDKKSQKYKNIIQNPHVSIMALDPNDSGRYLEIRGVVEEITSEGVLDEVNRQTKLYMGRDTYYGEVVPIEELKTYDGVIVRIRPTKFVK